jgi:hypothetical protein
LVSSDLSGGSWAASGAVTSSLLRKGLHER